MIAILRFNGLFQWYKDYYILYFHGDGMYFHNDGMCFHGDGVYVDLEYGLPVKLRDHALNIKDEAPKSDVGREYHLQNMNKEVRTELILLYLTLLLPPPLLSAGRDRLYGAGWFGWEGPGT